MNVILFDFGGTIDTDGVHWSEKFWENYERFGVKISKKDFEKAYVQTENLLAKSNDLLRATFYQTLEKQLTSQFTILKLMGEDILKNKMINACYRDVKKVIDRAKGILMKVSPHYRMGLVSNFYGNLEIVCREFGLDKFLVSCIDSMVVGVRKPNPEIFNLALRELNVSPENSYVVGDSYDRDIVPGKQLGCKTIWLKGKSWNMPTSTDAADYTISTLKDIEVFLLPE